MQQHRLKHVKNCSWWWSHWKSIWHYTHRFFFFDGLKGYINADHQALFKRKNLLQIWEKEKRKKLHKNPPKLQTLLLWGIFKNQTSTNLYSKTTVRNDEPQAFLQWSCLQCLLYSLYSAFTSMVQEQAMYHVLLCLIVPALWNIRKLNERHYWAYFFVL